MTIKEFMIALPVRLYYWKENFLEFKKTLIEATKDLAICNHNASFLIHIVDDQRRQTLLQINKSNLFIDRLKECFPDCSTKSYRCVASEGESM